MCGLSQEATGGSWPPGSAVLTGAAGSGKWDAWVAEGLKNGGWTGPFDQWRMGFYGGYMESGT